MTHLKQNIGKISAFIILDQLIKIIIYHFFFEYDLDLVGDFVRFHPIINKNLSWGGSFISALSNLGIAVGINLLLIILLISGYAFYHSKKEIPGKGVITIYVLGLAGSLCSLIDKLIWKGSLDFVQLYDWFIFDTKDIYISVAQCLFLVIGLKHSKEISALEYLKWCFKAAKR